MESEVKAYALIHYAFRQGDESVMEEWETLDPEEGKPSLWVKHSDYQALEAERDRLREAVKEYIEWHGSSCDDHVGDVYPDCPACQTDARLTQALGGGDE